MTPLQDPALAPERIQDAVREVLADPAYHRFADSALAQQLANRAAGLLWRLGEWLDELARSAPAVYWLLMSGLIVALILLVAALARSVRRAYLAGGENAPAHRNDGGVPAEPLLRANAAAAAAAGDFTEALRLLFRLVLHRFGLRHPGRLPRGWTNREFLRLYQDRPDQLVVLAAVVEALDEKWYGRRPCSAEEYHHLAAACEELLARS